MPVPGPTRRGAPKAAQPAFSPNPQQAAAIAHRDGPAAFIAAAGTGKTAILVQRLARLIADEGIDPSVILCVTFTRAAAEEMKKRATAALRGRGKLVKDLKDLRVVTFHGLGHLMLREKLEWTPQELNKALISGDPRQWLAEDILRPWRSNRTRGMNWNAPVADLLAAVDRAKEAQIAPEASGDYFRDDLILLDDMAKRYQEFFMLYEETKKKGKLYDLADLIYVPLGLLNSSPTYRKKWQGRFHYLQVDETQDTNPSQYQLIQYLAAPKHNVVVVGDPDQCQPPDAQVLTTNGYVSMADLNSDRHMLMSYDRSASVVVGSRNGGYDFRKAERTYSGLMFQVEADSHIARSTANHRWLAKWTEDARETGHVVYLMRKGNRFRVGWCKLFNVDRDLHFNIRARLEEADAAWMLHVCQDRTEASIMESYFATKYGLPMLPFHEVNGATHLTQQAIDGFFTMIDHVNLEERAIKCLEDCNRDIRYPFWTKVRVAERQGGAKLLDIEACNLVSGFMQIPVHQGDQTVEWCTLTLDHEPYSGPVYSLDVDKHHLYITNGLVTHNSIYGFRGSTPEESILSFRTMYPTGKIYPIEHNYRSTPQILAAANQLIAHNDAHEGFEKQLRPTQPDGPPVSIIAYEDQEREAEGIADTIQRIVNEGRGGPDPLSYKDIFVLSRTNHHLASLEITLARHRIPYRAVGGSSFFKRKTTRDILAYLALVDGMRLYEDHQARRSDATAPRLEDIFTPVLVGEQDAAFRTVASIPSRGYALATGKTSHRFTPTFFGMLAAFSGGKTLLQCCEEQIYSIPPEHQLAVKDCVALIRAVTHASHNHPAAAIRSIRELAYDAHLRQRDGKRAGEDDEAEDDEAARDDDGAKAEARFDELEELTRIADKHHTIRHFLNALAQLKDQAEDASKSNRDCVQLMTIHKSKGLEQKVVFVMGMVEGIFPHRRSYTLDNSDGPVLLSGIAEERRLAYVAITRAQRQLYLTTLLRYRGVDAIPSRFIHEAGLEATDEGEVLHPFLLREEMEG